MLGHACAQAWRPNSNFEKESQQLRTVYRRRNVTDGYMALCHTMCGVLATFLFYGAVLRHLYVTIIDRTATLCAIAHTQECLDG